MKARGPQNALRASDLCSNFLNLDQLHSFCCVKKGVFHGDFCVIPA